MLMRYILFSLLHYSTWKLTLCPLFCDSVINYDTVRKFFVSRSIFRMLFSKVFVNMTLFGFHGISLSILTCWIIPVDETHISFWIKMQNIHKQVYTMEIPVMQIVNDGFSGTPCPNLYHKLAELERVRMDHWRNCLLLWWMRWKMNLQWIMCINLHDVIYQPLQYINRMALRDVEMIHMCIFTCWYLEHFLWNWSWVSTMEPNWWWVNIA